MNRMKTPLPSPSQVVESGPFPDALEYCFFPNVASPICKSSWRDHVCPSCSCSMWQRVLDNHYCRQYTTFRSSNHEHGCAPAMSNNPVPPLSFLALEFVPFAPFQNSHSISFFWPFSERPSSSFSDFQ